MKFFLACATIAIALIVVSVVRRTATDPWKEYKTKYGKSYTETHDAQRKQLFLATDAFIAKHNSQTKATFLMEHNQFSDMTTAEFQKYLGLVMPDNRTRSLESLITIEVKDQTIPTSLDYRSNDCLPPVKNQGQCGSCWAFGAIAPIEFAQCKKYGSLVVLSEQQLIDCDPYDSGCGGGWYTNAWNYLQNVAGGSAQQSLYPYTGNGDSCKFTSSMIGARISAYGYLETPNAANMQAALQIYGPISVAITVVSSFQNYASGVYTDSACDNMNVNHAVVVVGWGTANGIDYWIVRNSWGTGWGQSGYILMERGVNRCQIESYPAAVIV
ncbi:ervatamin-B-like [Daphnia pulex]|uniref:ervatamin-B-like n=1 Tax=Daphnia pulex TaxID=6669 RepID=UPI001EE14E78|nr:ervatamin-B-like [Daphnia pulex]XP_046457570.1 ervatamin-B-like [Daphnia pulex]